MPYRITFQDGSTISYTYAADGTKLRTVHKIGSITTTTDYCGNVIYENGIAKLLITEAGYISLPDKKHHFYLQDHQGNNRIVADENGKVEETNHYYPFGGTFASENTDVQPYKYNGKELDTKAGLDWYDYGARHYDAALGRWHVVDPMSEKYYGISPYAYCMNNPVRFIDPQGKDVWDIDPYGKVVKRVKDKTQDAFYKVDNDGKRIEGEGSSIVFKYGTIKSQKKVAINMDDGKGNINKENITIFEVKGDENASDLFNFMINPETNKVEWGHVQTGSAGAEQNLIGTMNQKAYSSMGSYALGYGYTIRQSDHNHPGGTQIPSENDISNAKMISTKFPKAQFNIYVSPNQPIPYNKNSSYIKPVSSGASHGKRQEGKL